MGASGSRPLVPPPVQNITGSILLLRGHKVLLDAELAALYGVTTKRLNEQVKRNAERFPKDFMFRLSRAETEVAATIGFQGPSTHSAAAAASRSRTSKISNSSLSPRSCEDRGVVR